MELRGTAEQINTLREDEEFQRIMTNANLIVDDLTIVDGYVNEGIARQMERFREVVGRVPQATG